MQPVRLQESRCVTNNTIIQNIFSQEATPSSGGFQAGPWSRLDGVLDGISLNPPIVHYAYVALHWWCCPLYFLWWGKIVMQRFLQYPRSKINNIKYIKSRTYSSKGSCVYRVTACKWLVRYFMVYHHVKAWLKQCTSDNSLFYCLFFLIFAIFSYSVSSCNRGDPTRG